MKARKSKINTAETSTEENDMKILNDQGTVIAKAQLAWLLLLANNVVGKLKESTATSRGMNKERIVTARQKRKPVC